MTRDSTSDLCGVVTGTFDALLAVLIALRTGRGVSAWPQR
jgi:hypothetical protein